MKLLFLGVAPALASSDEKFQSNMLLESESGRKMLIDCGSDIKHALHAQGYSYADIDAVYISHLHADHVGGLEWLAFSKFYLEQKKAKLYISTDQVHPLWDHVLAGGMESMEDKRATLNTYFDVHAIKKNFHWENLFFQLIKTEHVLSNHKILPSYGLIIHCDTQRIFITTDTRFTPDLLKPYYDKADLIFHDCETAVRQTGQHAHYEDLKKLDKTIKTKTWLYDYNNGNLADAKKDGFLGYVKQGQCFILT